MNIDALLSLMKNRRSIRSYRPDPIPEEYVEKILEAGRWAPSSANSQPWDFIVIRDMKIKAQIHSIILEVIEKINTLRDFPFLKTFRAEYVLQAPVNIVDLRRPPICQGSDLPRIVAFRNVLIHGYAVVDNAIVWRAVQENLPDLVAALDRLLASSGAGS